MNPIRRLVVACLIAGTAAAAQAVEAIALVRGLSHPWGLAFLPDFERDGRMLVTERDGRMRVVNVRGERGAPIAGLPPVDARGQGGLLDVVLHPQFERNRWVYWSYSEAGEGGNSTAVARGKLELDGLQARLAEVQVVFRQVPKVSSTAHFGSRLVFARDGRLFITLGDRFSRRHDAQSLANHLGKVVRVEADGRVPADNPFVGRAGARPEIWSLGHRNVQGAALHPVTGELWTHEHGPQGGDEVNPTEAGRNYGWPVITYGAEYVTGWKIGEGTAKAGMEQPVTHWVPSIAPSGMAFLTSDRYPGWKGDLFVGALRAQLLVRLKLDGRRVLSEERLLQDLGQRIRDVRQGPDGWLYLLTDSDDGQVLRLAP
ncbi:MAG TPA: PQQ-dependent sugar dehydrogenase [Albitalea sp.]|uniref:PQQ-dependent sugar dehydrogenase n=1 Tax=Piscinibacter sp. TaxID=1903157 RepID=UPI002ED0D6D0